jgi:predicted nicotinamide N-methyase
VSPIPDRAAFIHANTTVMAPPLVPEVKLHLAHEAVPLWQKTEEELGEMGLPPPFWAFAWAGGQALSRHILDHPELVRGKRVVDLASGSGLVGIAAMKAGANSVFAADIDGFSVEAIRLNAALNDVAVSATADDLLQSPPPACDVILVGDLFYEKDLASRVYTWLVEAEERGITTLVGDPGRSYLPREKLQNLGEYKVRVTRDLEDSEIKWTSVWRLSRYC